ncbi:hypothetical protein JYT19_01120, partial [Sulfobacillus acidophilus]|nr:hypothetical protein [Sulfobacillus acidophilus]
NFYEDDLKGSTEKEIENKLMETANNWKVGKYFERDFSKEEQAFFIATPKERLEAFKRGVQGRFPINEEKAKSKIEDAKEGKNIFLKEKELHEAKDTMDKALVKATTANEKYESAVRGEGIVPGAEPRVIARDTTKAVYNRARDAHKKLELELADLEGKRAEEATEASLAQAAEKEDVEPLRSDSLDDDKK